MARWDKITSRGNIEDRRSSRGLFVSGGLGSLVLAMGITYLLGGNPLDVLVQADPATIQQSFTDRSSMYDGNDEYEMFASAVLGSTNDFWSEQFSQMQLVYSEPNLVLFRGGTSSGCGGAASSIGPHYCPLDENIYLDETFFEELQNRLGAEGGDVAEAYVIAHEVGHHVQSQLGLIGNRSTNDDSVAVELQADCFAGLWAKSVDEIGVFEDGEIQEAMDAAAAVGDDNIQRRSTGQISPESWTHGSSKQRVDSFMKGYQGSVRSCF